MNKALFAIFLLTAQFGWTYSYQRKVTIDHSKVPNSDQSNFPIYFAVTDPALRLVSQGGHVANASGFDIGFFTAASCTTPLAWEPESYDGTGGTLKGWVKVPNLSHTADTSIYVCYGDSGITTRQGAAGAVWDSSYKGVYHLADGSTLSTADSTASGLGNGTNHAVSPTTGKADGGASFSLSQYISLGNATTHYSTLTVEAWVNPASSAGNRTIVSKGYNGTSTEWHLTITDGAYHVGWYTYAGSVVGIQAAPTALSPNAWSHVVGTYDGSAWRLYINGSLDATSAGGAPTSTSVEMEIGGVATPTPGQQTWDGKIDEVRISNVARGADWIAAAYNNQSAPSTFLTIGAEAAPLIISAPATFHNLVVF